MDGIDNQGTILPRGIDYEDMDIEFIDFINSLDFSVDGHKLPVIFQTILKWSEFIQTWEHADEFKNIKLPFITIIRLPDVQVGTNQSGWWNIPSRRSYIYYKVPTWDGNRKGIDLYKIPQPTSVDLIYEVRLFTDKMLTLNKFNEKIQILFQSRQHYVDVKGHPIPIHLESVGDESKLDNLSNRKYYVQPFNFLMKGYILDEDEYEVKPTINRALIMQDIDTTKRVKKVNPKVKYDIIFLKDSIDEYTINPDFDVKIYKISDEENISSVIYKVNGVTKTLPFDLDNNDTLKVIITRVSAGTSSLLLTGVKY